MKQGFLFPDDQQTAVAPIASPLFISQTDQNGSEWGDFDSCLTEFRSNNCTLDGAPARIIGTPRTTPYATIEPVDLDAEPIRCCWDVMQDAAHSLGATMTLTSKARSGFLRPQGAATPDLLTTSTGRPLLDCDTDGH